MATLVYTDTSNQDRSTYLGPDQPVVSIGRAEDCTIRTDRKSVSRHHAEFHYNGGQFEVVDLDSSNGTWLVENDQRFQISHELLEDEDEIWCGDFIVFVLFDDASHPVGEPNNQGQSTGQQGYVGGPTEAADALDFGAEASQQGQQMEAGLAQQSAVDYDYDDIEELNDAEVVEIGADGDIEQLRAEKKSIEELASRQAVEISELQAELEDANGLIEQVQATSQTDSAQLSAVRDELEAAEQQNQDLRQQLEAAGQADGQSDQHADELAAELDNAYAQIDELRQELGRAENERANAQQSLDNAQSMRADLQRELDERDRRVDALRDNIEQLEDELSTAAGADDTVDRLREQLQETRDELDGKVRLLNEYERRNADLRAENDAKSEANSELREVAEQNEAKLAELFDERDQLTQQVDELDGVGQQLDQTRADLEDAKTQVADFRAEAQGLKQRLQLERRRAEEDDAGQDDQLEAELVEASERIAELEQHCEALSDQLEQAGEADDPSGGGGGLADGVLGELRQRLNTLERLTDAIERTDLAPLSTVDRIRLQSAVRETEPQQTLREAIKLLD